MSEASYRVIKRWVEGHITSGEWPPGAPVPSEPELCRRFGVARMTVNRAMRELAGEALIRRVPGLGSFVAEPVPPSDLLEIRNIADEIRERGHEHRAEVLTLESGPAEPGIALAFDLSPGTRLFHSVILHRENGLPLQLEDRWVNAALAPDYGTQDFAAITPNAYLSRVAPLGRAEHVVQAVNPRADIRRLLALEEGEACLLVTRRTWSGETVASTAHLYHPGGRFRLVTRLD